MKTTTEYASDRATLTIRVSFVSEPVEFGIGAVELHGATLPNGDVVGGWVTERPGEQAVYAAVLTGECRGQHPPDCERCEVARRARAWLTLGRHRIAHPDGAAPSVPHFLRLEQLT